MCAAGGRVSREGGSPREPRNGAGPRKAPHHLLRAPSRGAPKADVSRHAPGPPSGREDTRSERCPPGPEPWVHRGRRYGRYPVRVLGGNAPGADDRAPGPATDARAERHAVRPHRGAPRGGHPDLLGAGSAEPRAIPDGVPEDEAGQRRADPALPRAAAGADRASSPRRRRAAQVTTGPSPSARRFGSLRVLGHHLETVRLVRVEHGEGALHRPGGRTHRLGGAGALHAIIRTPVEHAGRRGSVRIDLRAKRQLLHRDAGGGAAG